MITRIEARYYRCLGNVGIDIPQYAVLVGANGAGKTTLLDIPRIISDCLQQRDIAQAFTQNQQERPARCATLPELVFCGKGASFMFAVEAELPQPIVRQIVAGLPASQKAAAHLSAAIRYEIQLEIVNARQLQITNEYLFWFVRKQSPERNGARLCGEVTPHRDWRFILRRAPGGEAQLRAETQKGSKARVSKIEPAMLFLPRVQFESQADFPAANWFFDLLMQNYLFYQPDLALLQSASPPGLPNLLMSSAANLPQMALMLQQDSMRFNLWQDHVKTVLPSLERIEIREREEDHHVYFRTCWREGYEVTSSGLSNGTLKILALTILPYLHRLPAVIFLEEPENGIHPRAIEAVLQSLSSVYDSQVLLSSHSPIVLANSELNQILCARILNNGAVDVIAGTNHPQLREWKGQIDLGALFAAEVLG